MEHEEYCARAARLLYKGLHPRLHPQQDREYSELVRTWLADHRLRQTLEGVATGLELVVVDVSEQGLVLAPRTPESRFAMSLTDYRQSLAGDTQRLSRGALALVQIGIAATFFPTADRLDDLEGYEGESIRLQDIREVVIALCQRLAQARAEDPQAVPEQEQQQAAARVAAALGGRDQLFDLAICEVFAVVVYFVATAQVPLCCADQSVRS